MWLCSSPDCLFWNLLFACRDALSKFIMVSVIKTLDCKIYIKKSFVVCWISIWICSMFWFDVSYLFSDICPSWSLTNICFVQNRAELPITLILGLATSSNALNQILPSSISDMLDTRNFHLVQALAKLEAVFQQIFFSPEMPFILSHSLMKNLDDKFMLHDFTVRSIEHSLKVNFQHIKKPFYWASQIGALLV